MESLAGSWALQIDTPFGQNIPATLTVSHDGGVFSGKVHSEMGDGELVSVTFDGQSVTGAISFDVAGHKMEAQITGEVIDQRIEGSITLENAPELSFTGEKIESSKGQAST